MANVSKAMQKYEAATAAYLFHLEANDRSPQTIQNYAKRLQFFRVFWEEANQADHKVQTDPGYYDIQSYRDYLLDQGCKASTVKQYLKELSAFFDWASDPALMDQRYYEFNPVSRRLVPDTRKASRRPYQQLLTDEQVMKLYRNNPPADWRDTGLWPRNYAIVVLLLCTELRNGELLALTPADLDFENQELVVDHGKGDKYRVVDFPALAQTAVRLYLASGIRPADAGDSDPLFGTSTETGRRGGKRTGGAPFHPGTAQWLSAVVERHVRAVTGVADIRTHDLRHVGARVDLNGGMGIEALQSKLGHASVQTTQVYSGKLLTRRHRASAARVMAERDHQAARNAALLSAL